MDGIRRARAHARMYRGEESCRTDNMVSAACTRAGATVVARATLALAEFPNGATVVALFVPLRESVFLNERWSAC